MSARFRAWRISPGVCRGIPYDMIWNAYDEQLKDELPGTKPLALWASEPNIFIMKDHDVRTPGDVKVLQEPVITVASDGRG